jgi:hypothetical protein
MAINRFFRRFCINRFGMGPLHYYSCRSDFRERGGIEDKEEDGEEEKKYYGGGSSTFSSLPRERKNKVLWRYSYLKNDSPYQRYGESPTPHISDTGVTVSLIRGVAI